MFIGIIKKSRKLTQVIISLSGRKKPSLRTTSDAMLVTIEFNLNK